MMQIKRARRPFLFLRYFRLIFLFFFVELFFCFLKLFSLLFHLLIKLLSFFGSHLTLRSGNFILKFFFFDFNPFFGFYLFVIKSF